MFLYSIWLSDELRGGQNYRLASHQLFVLGDAQTIYDQSSQILYFRSMQCTWVLLPTTSNPL